MVSRLVPRNQSGKQSRLLPRHLPRLLPRKVSGKVSGQLQEHVFLLFLKSGKSKENGCFPGFLENGGLEGLGGREGSVGTSIPYSIYISQFQTGTPKPRYIGFRVGGRETGTQNGQFRPVFGHILRPLSDPLTFHEIRALEHVFLLFLKSPKSELQTPSRSRFLG